MTLVVDYNILKLSTHITSLLSSYYPINVTILPFFYYKYCIVFVAIFGCVSHYYPLFCPRIALLHTFQSHITQVYPLTYKICPGYYFVNDMVLLIIKLLPHYYHITTNQLSNSPTAYFCIVLVVILSC